MDDYRGVSAPFLFQVELDGLYVGGFTEVAGLQSETEMIEYMEGGVNDFVHYFPKQKKHPRIVLKRGITRTRDLWDWYEGVSNGKIVRKTGTIILYHTDGYEICRWNFLESFPVKWTGPELNATSSGVAIESIEIVHSGLKTIFSKK
ncbi:phage tail protein [Paenibacillus agricola]|uniref:Phage tail protein n=1 Tax=Paenibacillus agricola TaxID=2716264 RepID=A0ABX0J7L5_9BACL|nr:phage tail protein [Paenibacillus agricola]NHN32422.1 phage tail protein [Paenibacillus agricola]